MKIIYKNPIVISLTGLFFMLIFIASCKKEGEGQGMPAITRVRTLVKPGVAQPTALDSTVTSGDVGVTYVIEGANLKSTNKVEFNGTAAYLNTALFSDNSIVVMIPATASWINQTGKLVLTNASGTVSFDFSIKQPPPVINDLSQFAGNAGDELTITGLRFDQVSSVKFGTVEARIVSSKSTELKVTVPNGGLGAVSVTTPGGTSTGPYVSYDGTAVPILLPFGFKHLFYDDQITAGYDFNFGGASGDVSNTEMVKRGSHAIKLTYTGNYAGYAVGSNDPVDLSDKTYVKFSIYGTTGTEGKVVKIGLNDFDNRQVSIVLHAGKWTTYVVPLERFQNASQPGKPTSLNWIGFQELSGNAPETIFLDDIGVY
ncbi:IPT/TIG domain-containing protein [Pedobacter sp. GR22-10]|uniref:IPT/TIG domain-containing protein n=1 Tax=Pedobacter sp. GR22-10 TaxID=2994472 RepID=UPI002246B8B8|nr:IPT/TIG domain-containing protein [Pedobacter sp. GR22-10]MCX2431561.1 IPT/TIG domain-containing protein [Pedobacter sp. GR22-10]